MTLIVVLKSADCAVIAADSLTTTGTKVFQTTTEKVHRLSSKFAITHAGASRAFGVFWKDVFNTLRPANQEAGIIIDDIYAHINTIVGNKEHKSNIGALLGGNTFIVAERSNEGIALLRLIRIRDNRKLETDIVTVSSETDSLFIDWLGDTDKLSDSMEKWRSCYSSEKPSDIETAERFAAACLRAGKTAAEGQGVATIGGDFIRLCTISKDGINTNHVLWD